MVKQPQSGLCLRSGYCRPGSSCPPQHVRPFSHHFSLYFFLPFSFFLRDRPLFFLCFSITYKVLPNIMDRGIVKEWIYSYWKRKKKKKRLEPF